MSERQTHTHRIAYTGREGGVGAAGARFPYWSFTKTVIAAAALRLVEARALDLDARLAGQPYSLRQHLAHTAGLPDYGPFEEYQAAVANREAPWSRDRLLDMVLRNGLLFEPGGGWSYSNTGYMVVRELIEETTAMPLGAVISDLICTPLGLSSIELSDTREQFARLHWTAAAEYDPRWVYHGCLTGTAPDASGLLHALVAGDVLRSDTLDQMLAGRVLCGAIPGRPWTRCGYALGLMTGAMGGAGSAVGHSGRGLFSVTAVYHFPDAPDPLTIACFAEGTDEARVEFAAAMVARGH